MQVIMGYSGMGKTWVFVDCVVEVLTGGGRALVLSDGDTDFLRKFLYSMDKSVEYCLNYCRFKTKDDVLHRIKRENPETFDAVFIDGLLLSKNREFGVHIDDVLKLEEEIGKPIVVTAQLARTHRLEHSDQVIQVSNYDGEKYGVIKHYTYSEMRARFDKIGGNY
ncbi:hypothetical protein M3_0095 [Lysinibacillus phage vB_LfM_LysYB1]|nr:hypothetical protein M3_0095 [Lysinibacillus phage vB_LfM_LysYB1]WAB25396.1 hypothetical protein M5_0218 [Lysinibacillus phage vB_LfM_LysYB2]